MNDALEQVEHVRTTTLIGIGNNMAIPLKHKSTSITARTAKHSGNHPNKEQTLIGAKVNKFSCLKTKHESTHILTSAVNASLEENR
ncbi:hypothetical protein, partial [Citrobacter freundii]|uniref:hypothetical protein n=1 Tax=Citrobacter freundii TaxID=546 RepID=UPI0019D13F2E